MPERVETNDDNDNDPVSGDAPPPRVINGQDPRPVNWGTGNGTWNDRGTWGPGPWGTTERKTPLCYDPWDPESRRK